MTLRWADQENTFPPIVIYYIRVLVRNFLGSHRSLEITNCLHNIIKSSSSLFNLRPLSVCKLSLKSPLLESSIIFAPRLPSWLLSPGCLLPSWMLWNSSSDILDVMSTRIICSVSGLWGLERENFIVFFSFFFT